MTTQLDRLTAARQALAELGVTVTELQDSQGAQYMPTFGEYLPIVIAAAGPGANRTYGTYWNRMATTWAHRRLDELHASEAMKTPPLQPPDHDAPAATADTPANTSSPQPAPSTTEPSPTTSSTTNTAPHTRS